MSSIPQHLIAATGDDARNRGEDWPGIGASHIFNATETTAFIGWDYIPHADPTTYVIHCLGLRFLTIPIAPDANLIVDSATLAIYYLGDALNTPTFRVYGADVDDCAAWADTTNPTTGDPGNRTRTTAYASLSVSGGAGWKNFDVKAVVQEILDRAGWANNNDMGFILVSGNTTYANKSASFQCYQVGENFAKLDITYHIASTYDETGKAQTLKIAQAVGGQAATRKETGKAQTLLIAQADTGVASFTEGRAQALLIAQGIGEQPVMLGELARAQDLLILAAPTDVAAMLELDKVQGLLITQESAHSLTLLESLGQLILMLQDVTDVYESGISVYDETGREQLLVLGQALLDAAIRAELGLQQPLLIIQGGGGALIARETRAQSLLIMQAQDDIAAFMERRPQSILVSQAVSDRALRSELGLNQALLILQSLNTGTAYEELGRSQMVLIVQGLSDIWSVIEALTQELRISQAATGRLSAVDLNRRQLLLMQPNLTDWYPVYWDLLVPLLEAEGLAVLPADGLATARIPQIASDEVMIGLPMPEGIVWLPLPPEVLAKIKGR